MAEQQAWMDAIQAQLQQLQQHNQQLAAQLAQQPQANVSRPKLPKPKPWDGRGDIVANYEIPVRRYLQHHNLSNDAAGVDHAIAYLPADLSLRAEAHWRQCQEQGVNPPTTIDAFFELVRTWRPQPDRVRAARERMEQLKQRRGKLTFYNEDFTRLSMELSTVMSAYDLNWRYVHGLQPTVFREIDGRFNMQTASLADIMTLANAAEARLRQTTETIHRYHPQQPTANDGPVPMEINRAEGQPFTGKCYRCGQAGHKARKCNTFSTKPAKPSAQHYGDNHRTSKN
jgi:hypothetical protein